jgi:hypothetical protein
MDTRKRVLGVKHPDTLRSIVTLASTFWSQGRWEEAEELEVQVMETRKKVLGAEYPAALRSMAHLVPTRDDGWRLVSRNFKPWRPGLGSLVRTIMTSIANLVLMRRNRERYAGM